MLNIITNAIGGVVAKSVLDYIKQHKEEVLMENMQAEILEGWIFKLSVAIEKEHVRQGVSHEAHVAVMAKFHEVVKQEFDTRRL